MLLDTLKGPKKLRLLYRASDYGFSAACFHGKCDNIENTLTVVRTEFGKTIAGFTKYPWTQNGDYKSDGGRHCWLLSLDLKQKMVPKCDLGLIRGSSECGPVFGGHNGHDLYLIDKCHENNGSRSNFPTYYNFEGEPKYENNQESYLAFCGATKDMNFKVEEYEVF